MREALVRWDDFAEHAPAIAEVGKSLLFRVGQGEVGILATVDPHVASVCPIFTAVGSHLSVSDTTPKLAHLRSAGRYALHAMVGADDLEFQIRRRVREVEEAAEKRGVHAAIQFDSYDPQHPIFELLIAYALCVTWPTAAESRKQSWHAATV